MRKIQLVLVALIVLILSAFKADHVITIYMIGDSTMSNKPLEGIIIRNGDGDMSWEVSLPKMSVWRIMR